MFDIFFEYSDPVPYDEDGWLGLRGRAVLGDLTETFVAPLGWWSRPAYERQWLDAANRLMDRHQSGFVLEPARLWWTAWVVGSDVFVRQQLLVGAEHANAWRRAPEKIPYKLIGARPTDNLAGTPSEWRISLPDIRDFLDRRANQI